MDPLVKEVEAQETLNESFNKLIEGIRGHFHKAGTDPVAQTVAHNELKEATPRLATALVANTPSAIPEVRIGTGGGSFDATPGSGKPSVGPKG
jgi:hypothetical protein